MMVEGVEPPTWGRVGGSEKKLTGMARKMIKEKFSIGGIF